MVPSLRQGTNLRQTFFTAHNSDTNRVSFNSAVRRAAPAVVDIYSSSIDTRSFPYRGQPIERTKLGSGVIMDKQGHILTCNHVISDAETIEVRLSDGRSVQAQQVGQDIYTDLAVLKIDAENLSVIPQKSHINSEVGDVVLAIGNPYNIGQTITQGVISATGRNGLSNVANNGYAGFIQMDATLNEGNSGGALVDSNGNLVGINNANFKTLDSQHRVKDVAGIFFAVPYELAKKVMDSIIADGRVIRGYMGITGKIPSGPTGPAPGVLVEKVEPYGPAAQAGIQAQDTLIKVNGKNIDSLHQVLDLVAESKPGTLLTFDVVRNNKVLTIPVKITELGAN